MAPKLQAENPTSNHKRLIFISVLGGVAISLSFINIIFFSKESCGCGSEAKTYVGSMNRAQQAYFLDNESFANSITSYSGNPTETEKYKYYSKVEKKIITPDYEILVVSNYSQSKKENLQNYYGLAWATKSRNEKNLTQKEPINNSIVCKTSKVDLTISLNSKVKFSKDFKNASCPKGMELLQY